MSQTTSRRRVGINLKFFQWEDEKTHHRESGALDLEKFSTALRGYHATLKEVGYVQKDDQFKEFVTAGQQILSELNGEERQRMVELLKWYLDQTSVKVF